MHFTVLDTLHLGDIVRHRGEPLCRPRTSLPNLELLERQLLEGRKCCPACIDLMARIRLHGPVDLPPSSGMLAGDLIRELAKQREAGKKRPRRHILDFPDRK